MEYYGGYCVPDSCVDVNLLHPLYFPAIGFCSIFGWCKLFHVVSAR